MFFNLDYNFSVIACKAREKEAGRVAAITAKQQQQAEAVKLEAARLAEAQRCKQSEAKEREKLAKNLVCASIFFFFSLIC